MVTSNVARLSLSEKKKVWRKVSAAWYEIAPLRLCDLPTHECMRELGGEAVFVEVSSIHCAHERIMCCVRISVS